MDELKQILERLETKLDAIIGSVYLGEILKQKQMTVSDIAKMYKVSRSSIYEGHRYLIPEFGIKDPDDKGHLKYSMQEVLDWNKRPVEERKREWNEMTNLKNIIW